MPENEKINYVEFAAKDMAATKVFFEAVFGWTFTDYGSEYTAFANQGLNGGFYSADLNNDSSRGGALIVFYSSNIHNTLAKVVNHSGVVVKPLFNFPGGRRFHFTEPSGNEFAVWSEN